MRGPLVYYVVAAFDLLTVTTSLYLNHRIMKIYVDSVAANQEWARRMESYSALAGLAADVNAPGNDVFDSREVPRESGRMEQALIGFRSRLEELRGELQANVPPAEARPLLSGLDEIDVAMSDMVEEARLIFTNFEEGRNSLAGERMATMDRRYSRLLRAQRELSAQVAAAQNRTFERQTAAAATLQRFEYAIGGAILVMVVAATAYGRRIWRQWMRAAEERAQHIADLQAAGNELRRARSELEIRVEERTRELREMQETARREERMAAMGSLVAGVAQEVRNPLFGISSTLDAFEARYGRDDSFKKYVEVLRRETDRLGSIMRDLLEYGKPPRLELAEHDLAEVVDEALGLCRELARSSGVVLAKVGSFDAGRVALDRSRIVQVLRNLIENAIQHSPKGGRVLVRGEREIDGSRPRVRLSVKDEGLGFRSEDIPRLFEPFFTRRHGGTGMGLPIAQRVVIQHGGTLEAANDPAGGAIVTVNLPATAGVRAATT